MDKKGMVIDRSSGRSRRARLGGWVLTQFQVALALLGVAVCLVMFFGLGFLFGVWYQSNEKIRPADNAIALAEEQLQRERAPTTAEKEMTFYSTLTKRDDGATSSDVTVRSGGAAVPAPVPTGGAAVATSAPASAPNSASSESPGVQSRTEPGQPALSADRRLGASTTQPVAQGTATARVEPAQPQLEPNRAPAEPTVAEIARALEPRNPAAKPPSASASRQTPSASGFTVQVGSFRKAVDAERLQQRLSQKGYDAQVRRITLPGKGLWHRVRVGSFSNRLEAKDLADQLKRQEKITVLVTSAPN